MSKIRIVLVSPTHPGNIGAAARAMKTMGLRQLYLVKPRIFPHNDATAMAAGADDILASAIVVDSLETALHGCQLIIGTSARTRAVEWPTLEPKIAAAKVAAEVSLHEVAIVFGREHAGLTNEELQLCQYQVTIPSNPAYSSLNLAAAVQIICYELRLALQGNLPQPILVDEWINANEMEGFYQHLTEVLIAIQFLDPQYPRQVLPKLRRLFARTRLNRDELNILRGILAEIQRNLAK